MISSTRKAELQSAGFYVENMGAEHGPDWEGQYRWMNSVTNDFQDSDTTFDEEVAWDDCSEYAELFNIK